jgi:tetratricopeptide (TPR) repeat protein
MSKRVMSVVLLSSVLAACGIPNLKPFSDATAEMATVLKQGFERARTSLGAAAETAGDEDQFTAKLRELDDRWKPTRKALSSLVAYSDSLAAVAEAGKKGKETMAKVTGALSDLASAVGAIPLTGAAPKIIEAVGAKIIEMQAGNDIRKAVTKAAEAVDIIAPVLEQNFADLRAIHNAAAAAWEARVLERWSFERNYYEALISEQQRIQYLLTLIIDYQSAPARLQWRAALATAKGNHEQAKKFLSSIPQEQLDQLNALKSADSVFGDMNVSGKEVPARVEARQQQLLGLINAQRKEIALLEPAYRQSTADLTGVRDARATGDHLLARSGEAIAAWQKAHRSLEAAAQGEQSRPSVADLLSIVGEISTLLK